jgi:hypothetical protein
VAAFALLVAILPGVAAAQAPAPPLPPLERKIAEARSSGSWTIEEGEHLYRIARYFSNDDATVGLIVKDLVKQNEHALINGDPARLVVGARLRLPSFLVVPSPRTSIAAVPRNGPVAAAAAPPRAPAATAGTPAPALPPGLVPPIGVIAEAQAVSPLPKPPAPPAYVDRLIGGALEASPEDLPDARARDESPGLKSWTIDYRLDQRDSTSVGSSLAQGIALLHRRETEQYGNFALDAQVGHYEASAFDRTGNTNLSRFTLYHDSFAIAPGVTSASVLGVTRNFLTPWLANSYRIFLPTSTMSGVSTILDAGPSQWLASYGQVGQLVGQNVQGFERTSGRLATVGYSREVAPSWLVGANAVSLQGNDRIPDNNAITLGTEFSLSPRSGPIRLQALLDNDGNKGFWGDAQFRSGRFSHRVGGYQIDPGTRFGEGNVQNDTRGAYWRSEYRIGSDFTAFGIDYLQSNINRNPDLGGSSGWGAYVNTSLRIDRATTVGGGFALREEQPRVGPSATGYSGAANLFVSRVSALGTSRLDAGYSESRVKGGGNAESVSTLQWNQEWPRLGSVESSTLFTFSDERLVDRHIQRNVGSVSLRGPLYGALRWDATLTAADVDDGIAPERNYNSSLAIDWAISERWYLNLQWLRNRIQASATNPAAPFVREDQLNLIVRYEDAWGTPYPRLGIAGGRSGTGRVSGVVFFDDNNDGVRQPTERGAPGITVVLNNRTTQVTDRDGRYAFNLVPSGPGSVTLVLDRVPLPWGLADDSPRSVQVGMREDSRLDIPLTRVSP